MLLKHEFLSPNLSRAAVAYILASESPQPDTYGATCSSQLNTSVWRHYLTDYVNHVVVDFLQFGWPINYVKCFASAYSHQSSVSSFLS